MELRKVFGPKTGEVTGHWKICDIELLRDVGCSPNIKLDGKLRRMSWAGHVTGTGGIGEVHTGFCWGNMMDDTAWKTT